MGALYLTGFVVLLTGGYALSCWWFPFAYCRCCNGSGRHERKDGKVLRDCRWCRRTGRRLRIGRRLYNAVQKRRRKAAGA